MKEAIDCWSYLLFLPFSLQSTIVTAQFPRPPLPVPVQREAGILCETRGGPGDGPVPLDHLRPLGHVHGQALGIELGVVLEDHVLGCAKQTLVASAEGGTKER